VGDLYGECIVLRGWEEDIDQAIYVERDTPIYHGDLIITRNKGGVILSYSDMSSFHVDEGSAVIIDDKEEKVSNFSLVAGTIWTNLKRMTVDGSLDIEMSQAVAGIKGTTLVCEAYDGVSTLKVLEGTVEYTSTSTGEMAMVGAGETVDAMASGLSEIMTFDVQEEKNLWKRAYEYISKEEAKADEAEVGTPDAESADDKRNETGTVSIIIILGASVLAAVVATLLIINKKKQK
jgi:hypothetical protein